MNQSPLLALYNAYVAAEGCVDRLNIILPQLESMTPEDMKREMEDYHSQRGAIIGRLGNVAVRTPLLNARIALGGPTPTLCGISAPTFHDLAFELADRVFDLLHFQHWKKTKGWPPKEIAGSTDYKVAQLERMVAEAQGANFTLLEAGIKQEIHVAKEAMKQNNRGSDKSIVLGDTWEAPMLVRGKEKKAKSYSQWKAIKAVADAGEEGLSKDDLEAIVPSGRAILRELEKDPDWGAVLLRAGHRGNRYRFRP